MVLCSFFLCRKLSVPCNFDYIYRTKHFLSSKVSQKPDYVVTLSLVTFLSISKLSHCLIVTLSHCHIVTFLSISKLSHCHIVTFVSISKLSHTQLWITTSNVYNTHCLYQMSDLEVLNAIGTDRSIGKQYTALYE